MLRLVGSTAVWREPPDTRPAGQVPVGTTMSTRPTPPTIPSPGATGPRLTGAAVVRREPASTDPAGDVPVGATMTTRPAPAPIPSTGQRLAGSGSAWDERADPTAGAAFTLGVFVDDGSGNWTPATSGVAAAVAVRDANGDFVLTPIGSADPAAPRAELLVTAGGDFYLHGP